MIILLTGASSGFGRDAVLSLLRRGHTVIAGLRGGEERLLKVMGAERERYKDRLIAYDLHIEKSASFDGVADLVSSKFGGRLDVLVNNAGYGQFGPLEDLTEIQIREQMEVNYFGPIFLTRKLLPFLRAAKGRVINVSSGAGLMGLPFFGSYCASKFALEGHSESMADELRPHGVRIAVIEPGMFATKFASSTKTPEKQTGHYPASDRWLDRQERLAPLYGDPRWVVTAMVHACERRRLPFRISVGPDMILLRFIRHLLPSNFRVWLKTTLVHLITKSSKPA